MSTPERAAVVGGLVWAMAGAPASETAIAAIAAEVLTIRMRCLLKKDRAAFKRVRASTVPVRRCGNYFAFRLRASEAFSINSRARLGPQVSSGLNSRSRNRL